MDQKSLPRHPIQLTFLGVKELSIKSNLPPEDTISLRADKASFTVTYPNNFDPAHNAFSVTVALEVGMTDQPEDPYSMRIELRGFFSVDTTRFAVEHVPSWAENGAMFVLYPFLREHAHALSRRAGFKPFLLPLLEVPTFRIEKAKPRVKRTKTKQD